MSQKDTSNWLSIGGYSITTIYKTNVQIIVWIRSNKRFKLGNLIVLQGTLLCMYK